MVVAAVGGRRSVAEKRRPGCGWTWRLGLRLDGGETRDAASTCDGDGLAACWGWGAGSSALGRLEPMQLELARASRLLAFCLLKVFNNNKRTPSAGCAGDLARGVS